ncbi:MAG: DUF934 domain-containing protein [Agarilytica sp.]
MPKLIKNGCLSDDDWQHTDENFDFSQLDAGNWILPLGLYEQAMEHGFADLERLAIRLTPDQDVLSVKGYVKNLPMIALHFDAFADGRSFSQARILRDHLDFAGEIRAEGGFIQDQLHYLSRCGVNAFVLPDDVAIESALLSLDDFSNAYQAACDEPQPLFRRRT